MHQIDKKGFDEFRNFTSSIATKGVTIVKKRETIREGYARNQIWIRETLAIPG